jgi:hypothetical protein
MNRIRESMNTWYDSKAFNSLKPCNWLLKRVETFFIDLNSFEFNKLQNPLFMK